MHTTWQLQEAENRFSKVVDEAVRHGPQTITKRGKEVVVVISAKQFKKLTKPKQSLVEFFQSSPLRGVDLDLERSSDSGRDVDL